MVTMSDRMTVGEYLDASTSADAWFLRNEILDFKPMTEGAGQVRAVSRLAFELAVKKQKLSPLYEAIRQLHISTSENREGEDNAFRVIIVSTLAGGTGSGIILPLALHIRQYMREVYRRRDVIIRGIFLMADCLDNVVGSETERRSLRSNTYAAVKELDAFMKKADGYLDERYGPYICLEERSGVKNSSLLSYNYCYLFSARNEKSNELYSFEELQDYVVLCIYAQILGPMQELHNSIEDNVLKSTMTANISGRASEFNRYCAAGISILEYPYRNILDYLSIEKMLDVFSEQWMEIDDAYEKEMDRLREKEKAGYYVQKPERSDFYRNYVLSADDGNLLFRQIRRETETGSGEKKWDAYREALDGDINEQVKQREELWKGKKKNCTLEMKMLRDRPLRDRKRGLGVLREAFVKLYSAYMQEGAPDEASVESRYFGEISEDYNVEPHHFYYWLKSGDGLIHMNSVRYFLYWTIAKLKDQRVRAERELEDCGSLNEICRQLEDRIRNTQERMIWVSRRKRDSIANDCKYVMGLLDTYSTLTLKIRIYQVGMDRLSRISESLEDFYRMFSYNCRQIRQDKDSLYKQMTQNKSRAVTYVGTSADYLDAVREDVKDYQKDTETNRRLSGRIFEVLWNVSKQDEKDRMNRIRSLFRKECLDFWRENLEKEYAYALDMDIVEAIRREGAWKKGKDGAGNYLKCMLSDMWDYTVPFLQTESAGNAGLEKNFCTYDWGVFSHHDNETKQILERHLTQNGGTDGKGEVDKYTIYFYRVLYNLKATDLQEFLVGQLAQGDVAAGYFDFELLPENAGRTFRDYYEAVNMQDATRLTPHIDKRWGNILMMPDLNPAYTVRRETQIYQAFFRCGWTERLPGMNPAIPSG